MQNLSRIYSCAVSFGLCAALLSAAPTGSSAAENKTPVALPVGACINIGNTLEVRRPQAPITRSDLVRISEAGFETVRIPVRWDDKSGPAPAHRIETAWMDGVAQVVDWALAEDLNVILNSHHFSAVHDNPQRNAEWHGALWRQIGERFAHYPDGRLWFELENEPRRKLNNDNLVRTLAPALSAVRRSNPTRPIIYGGDRGSGVWSLATLELPDDPNVFPTIHYYEPFNFTHQGASWLKNRPPTGRRFGTQPDRQRIAKDVRTVQRYIQRTGKVPFIGETGVISAHVAVSQRATYHRAVYDAFTPLGVGICAWSYANTFPLFDRDKGRWLPGMLSAMGLPE